MKTVLTRKSDAERWRLLIERRPSATTSGMWRSRCPQGRSPRRFSPRRSPRPWPPSSRPRAGPARRSRRRPSWPPCARGGGAPGTRSRFCCGVTRPKTRASSTAASSFSGVSSVAASTKRPASGTPARAAMAETVRGSSPEMTLSSTPCSRKKRMVSGAEARISSRMATQAHEARARPGARPPRRSPAPRPPRARAPCRRRRARAHRPLPPGRARARRRPRPSRARARPPRRSPSTCAPSRRGRRAAAGRGREAELVGVAQQGERRSRWRRRRWPPRWRPWRPRPRASSRPGAARTEETSISPEVIVPVLSRQSVSHARERLHAVGPAARGPCAARGGRSRWRGPTRVSSTRPWGTMR